MSIKVKDLFWLLKDMPGDATLRYFDQDGMKEYGINFAELDKENNRLILS